MKYNDQVFVGKGLLNKAQNAKDDEYYTKYNNFEFWLKTYLLDKLKDKVIYCPCDAEWSNIVKVLKDYKDKLQYKELIYTADDFRGHGDIFDKADVIITNPPFSLFKEFIPFLKDHNCQYFVYGGNTGVFQYYLVDDIITEKIVYLNYKLYKTEEFEQCGFLRPDGSEKRVAYNIYTNIPGIQYADKGDFELTKTLADVEDIFGYIDNTKILNIKDWRHYPKDYYGIAAISPIHYCNWRNYFDIITTERFKWKQNNKNLFVKWIVRLKGSNAKLEDYLVKDEKTYDLFQTISD